MTEAICDILGPIVIRIDDSEPPSDLLWRKNVALLLYLAFSPHWSRTRDQIVGMLWGDKPDAAARQSAREAIRTLRKHLGPDAIRTRGDVVTLDITHLQFDTGLFVSLVEAGAWSDAAAVVRGEFAEGFAVSDCGEFETWLAAERAVWNRRVVDALSRAAKASLDAGELGRAVELSERALRLDRGAEDAMATAMRADTLAGRRPQALERFEEMAAYLKELGTEPSRDLLELTERIRLERSRPLTAVQRQGTPEPRDPTLVGRRDALAVCLRTWTTCRSKPRAGVLIIEADPGLGKSRLAEETLQRARLDGATTVTLRCVQGDRESAGSGLQGLIHSELVNAPGVGSTPADALGALAAAAPEWGDAFPHVAADPSLPIDRALEAAVEAAVAEHPLALLLDDAQWLDSTSFHLALTLLRDLSSRPLLLLITTTASRDELDRLGSHLGRELAGEAVHLSPLAQPDVTALVDERLPDLPQGQRRRIARRLFADSGGIPLLVVELLKAVASGMELSDSVPVWPLTDRTLDQTLPSELPPTVVGAIRVRFRAVSQTAQQVLRVLAVAGDRLSTAQILGAAGGEAAAVHEALDELEWDRLVQSDRRGYAFVARIVRQVILDDLTTAGQRRRIRGSLEGDAGAPPS